MQTMKSTTIITVGNAAMINLKIYPQHAHFSNSVCKINVISKGINNTVQSIAKKQVVINCDYSEKMDLLQKVAVLIFRNFPNYHHTVLTKHSHTSNQLPV
jgi:hypothetical protein